LLQNTIGAHEQPVATIWQHLSTQPRAFERAANRRIKSPGAPWRRANVTRRCDQPGKTAQKLAPKRLPAAIAIPF
jgi:hypothetical protein